jgi:hypothetical protein
MQLDCERLLPSWARSPEGDVLGTLCHYDVVPRDSSQIDLALMCEIASALEQWQAVPDYPK